MSNPLDRALKDRAEGPSNRQKLAEAAIRRVQHQKREIIVLDETPVQSRVASRESSNNGAFSRASSSKKTRMDILSSDLYADPQGSDDSLPDLSAAFGLKTNHDRSSKLQPSASPSTPDDEQNIPSSSQEMFRRINRTRDQGADALARIRQIYLDGSIPRQTQSSTTRADPNPAQQHIQIDLDPISSNPIRSTRHPAHAAKTFNPPPKILSRPPLPTLGARTPLHRVQTFPAVNPARPSLQEKSRANSSNIYYEISDDDDEDLRAAIAASLADLHTSRPNSPSIAPARTSSVFLYPDEILSSSPPMSQASVKHAPPSSSQLSAKDLEPPSSGSSARVRDDTRRMLMALDELTTNTLKRKNEEVPTQAKKKSTAKKSGSENGDAPKPRKRAALTQDEKDARVLVQSEKQAAKEAKRLAKEAQLAEKAEHKHIEALNRLKTRKEACPEIIAYLPPTLPDTLHNHILNFMEPLGVDTREWTTATMDVIKFVRKVNAEWDEEGGLFRPCNDYRRDEEWIIHWLKADKFLDLTSFDQTGLAWKFHLQKLKTVVPGAKILVVLEGLTGLLAKAKTVRNRVHDAAVRAQLGGPAPPRKDERLEGLDVEEVENALIEMQFIHEIRIVQTSSSPDSAEWISILTADIASIPYRRTRMFLDRSFCMDVGQIKSGTGTEDTFHKMLQQVHRVTPQVADSIMARYKSVHALIRGFQQGGPSTLEDLPVRLTKTGGVSERRLGPALSKKVYDVFMSRDQFALA